MKVLVASSNGQGQRKNDFNHVPDGELLKFGMECDGEAVDGRCGCRRSFVGMQSHTATTTATVADLDMTAEDFRQRLAEAYIAEGWGDMGDLSREVQEMLRIAAIFKPGAIIEKRGNKVQTRTMKARPSHAR